MCSRVLHSIISQQELRAHQIVRWEGLLHNTYFVNWMQSGRVQHVGQNLYSPHSVLQSGMTCTEPPQKSHLRGLHPNRLDPMRAVPNWQQLRTTPNNNHRLQPVVVHFHGQPSNIIPDAWMNGNLMIITGGDKSQVSACGSQQPLSAASITAPLQPIIIIYIHYATAYAITTRLLSRSSPHCTLTLCPRHSPFVMCHLRH